MQKIEIGFLEIGTEMHSQLKYVGNRSKLNYNWTKKHQNEDQID